MDKGESKGELARLLRENSSAISARLEGKFVEEYPGSRANDMNVEFIHRWTMSWLEAQAHALENDEVELAVHRGDFGRIVRDKDDDLSRFASSMATTLFMARHVAPLIYFFADDWGYEGRGPEMVRLYEELVQDVLAAHCRDYLEDIRRPGALARKWDILSGLESEAKPELTPNKKHGSVKAFGSDAFSDRARLVWEGEALTNREKEVLEHLVSGRSNGEIAAALGIAQNTVKNHVARIFDKFGVNSRVELLAEIVGDQKERR